MDEETELFRIWFISWLILIFGFIACLLAIWGKGRRVTPSFRWG